jgi:hypothetical protein
MNSITYTEKHYYPEMDLYRELASNFYVEHHIYKERRGFVFVSYQKLSHEEIINQFETIMNDIIKNY